jgi:hypothetical protein
MDTNDKLEEGTIRVSTGMVATETINVIIPEEPQERNTASWTH